MKEEVSMYKYVCINKISHIDGKRTKRNIGETLHYRFLNQAKLPHVKSHNCYYYLRTLSVLLMLFLVMIVHFTFIVSDLLLKP